MTLQELAVIFYILLMMELLMYFTRQDAGIHITNVMEFSATIELSAPKDLAKLYNFVREKYSNNWWRNF